MIKETSHIATKEVKVVDKTEYFCDRCGNEIENSYGTMGDGYSHKVQFKSGSYYPEGSDESGVRAYFCPECAQHIIGVLKNEGVKFEEFERSW